MVIQVVRPASDRARRVARPLWRQLVGAALRARRLGAGLRLRDVAERAGISAQYLSEVERGRKDPSSEMLESICGALDLDLLDVVREVGHRLARAEIQVVRPAPVGIESPWSVGHSGRRTGPVSSSGVRTGRWDGALSLPSVRMAA